MKNKIRLLAFLAGFISLELEIIGTRLISPIFGNTIYVWTSLISITLLFLAIGYNLGGKLADKGKIKLNTLGIIIFTIGCYIILLPIISKYILLFFWRLGVIAGPLTCSFVIFFLPMTLLGFIVPTSIKLATRSLSEVGGKSGEIYSIATIGSIAGALVTGFYLLLHIGIRNSCLYSGVVLILVSLFLFKSRKSLLLLLIVPLIIIIPHNKAKEAIEEFPSFYNSLVVSNEGGVRKLYRTGNIVSTMSLKTNKSVVKYDEVYDVAWMYNPDYKDVLVIGFGTGMSIKRLLEKHDSINIEAVEIEPRMEEIAKEYFGWDDEIKINHDDGRHFLRTKGKYDVIIIDLIVGHDASFLGTKNFFEEAKKHLNYDGAIIINIVSSEEGETALPLRTEYTTLKSVFKEVILLNIEPNINKKTIHNLVLFATKEKIDRNLLLQNSLNNTLYLKNKNVSYKEIIQYGLDIEINDSRISTDDLPIIEFYDIEYNLKPNKNRRLKGGIELFI